MKNNSGAFVSGPVEANIVWLGEIISIQLLASTVVYNAILGNIMSSLQVLFTSAQHE